jgi:hypothetical protein
VSAAFPSTEKKPPYVSTLKRPGIGRRLPPRASCARQKTSKFQHAVLHTCMGHPSDRLLMTSPKANGEVVLSCTQHRLFWGTRELKVMFPSPAESRLCAAIDERLAQLSASGRVDDADARRIVLDLCNTYDFAMECGERYLYIDFIADLALAEWFRVSGRIRRNAREICRSHIWETLQEALDTNGTYDPHSPSAKSLYKFIVEAIKRKCHTEIGYERPDTTKVFLLLSKGGAIPDTPPSSPSIEAIAIDSSRTGIEDPSEERPVFREAQNHVASIAVDEYAFYEAAQKCKNQLHRKCDLSALELLVSTLPLVLRNDPSVVCRWDLEQSSVVLEPLDAETRALADALLTSVNLTPIAVRYGKTNPTDLHQRFNRIVRKIIATNPDLERLVAHIAVSRAALADLIEGRVGASTRRLHTLSKRKRKILEGRLRDLRNLFGFIPPERVLRSTTEKES